MRIFLALIIVACLTACERKSTDADLQLVKFGMTMKEVESILGKPTKIEDGGWYRPPTTYITRYIYEQKGKRIDLTFENDRLVPNRFSIGTTTLNK